jgi:hypothetical protein
MSFNRSGWAGGVGVACVILGFFATAGVDCTTAATVPPSPGTDAASPAEDSSSPTPDAAGAVGATDATVPSDSGSSGDAGADATMPPDSGSPFDAGADAAGDVTVPSDAGQAADAGADAADGSLTDASDAAAIEDAAADADASTQDAGADASCTTLSDCTTGSNCVTGSCVAAVTSCLTQSQTYGSTDGEYWIAPDGGAPTLAYCDMTIKAALCTQTEGTNTGVTRDSSHLSYSMVSVLDDSSGVCNVWAVYNIADGYPLDALSDAGTSLTTCQALGFLGDQTIGACLFGSDPGYTACGFTLSGGYFRYGNQCVGCTTNDGTYPDYVLQGPMFSAAVMSSVDGTTMTSCKIR